MQEIFMRRLSPDEVPCFIQLRLEQLSKEGSKLPPNLEASLFSYYQRHMADGSFVSWVACCGGQIIATSGISLVEKPPYASNPSGKIGLVSSMYTKKPYRRRGIAKALLGKIVAEAKAWGCGVVQITASDQGVLLYEDFGFEKNANFLQFQIK